MASNFSLLRLCEPVQCVLQGNVSSIGSIGQISGEVMATGSDPYSFVLHGHIRKAGDTSLFEGSVLVTPAGHYNNGGENSLFLTGSLTGTGTQQYAFALHMSAVTGMNMTALTSFFGGTLYRMTGNWLLVDCGLLRLRQAFTRLSIPNLLFGSEDTNSPVMLPLLELWVRLVAVLLPRHFKMSFIQMPHLHPGMSNLKIATLGTQFPTDMEVDGESPAHPAMDTGEV